jgi:coenzyme F420-reducing hydrogenase alpha subunit
MLATPDFLRVPDVAAIARSSAELVRNALVLKGLGNRMMATIGGREVHPVSLKLGGIYRAPSKESLVELSSSLQGCIKFARETVELAASFEKPTLERDVTFVCLKDPDRYAVAGGDIVSNRGLHITPAGFEGSFTEHQVEYSNALRLLTKSGEPYMVGPLARTNLNFSQLHPTALASAEKVGFRPPVTNPFESIVARAIELVHAIEEIAAEVREYTRPVHPSSRYDYREGRGFGVSEAPRGVLYHRYDVNGEGRIAGAKITPPTSQNLIRVEEDVRQLAPAILSATPDEARRLGEMAVRNYDPCISCATHFLTLRIKRA